MKRIDYKHVGETLYKETLDNGLQVFYLPKKDYNKTYALFTTNFGSLDTKFTLKGETDFKVFPEGIAHFLEHKLFEKEDGDVFQDFGKLGAASNAFTSFSRTSYLFSTSDNVYENLELLLDFVQEPYFTEESVEKEQGIITQEIQMYQDDAEWRLYFGMLQNMYPESPLADDIAGTPASIRKITAQDLYDNYYNFYQPSNMTLFVTGPFEVEEMSSFVRENQDSKNFEQASEIKIAPFESAEPVAYKELEMDVIFPKLALGFKGEDELVSEGRELLKYRLSNYILLSMLFGGTSQSYEDMYNSGLIDDSFDYSFEVQDRFHLANFACDTDQSEELSERLTSIYKNYRNSSDFTKEHLELVKKEYLGNFYQSLNSLEFIANQFASNIYPDVTFFEYPEILMEIDMDTIEKNADSFLRNMKKSIFIIKPKA